MTFHRCILDCVIGSNVRRGTEATKWTPSWILEPLTNSRERAATWREKVKTELKGDATPGSRDYYIPPVVVPGRGGGQLY